MLAALKFEPIVIVFSEVSFIELEWAPGPAAS
jgi:hypothetical protein